MRTFIHAETHEASRYRWQKQIISSARWLETKRITRHTG